MTACTNARLGVMICFLAICFAAGPSLGAGDVIESYAQTVLADKALAALWRMEGDLSDGKGEAKGTLQGGKARFVRGPAGGRALALGPKQFVTVGKAPHLDLPATTVELLFSLTARPGAGYNPCLIAKRSGSRQTRFSIHIQRNLQYVDVWNGRSVLSAELPFGPLAPGEWHHLAVAADAKGLAVYVDGVRCAVEGGSFTFAAKGLPLQLGASQPDGHEPCRCALDEVAIYSRVLSQKDVDGHLEALGWADRAKTLREQQLAREKELERTRQEKLAKRLKDPRLFARGATRVYRDEYLTGISFTLGGIGAGCIGIDGRAVRHSWQIFNNFAQAAVPNSFFAVRARAKGGRPVVRALQTAAAGPFQAMKSLTFRGEFPFAWYDFQDPALPVAVSLEAFTPLVPLRAKDSAIPCAVFNLAARNASEKPVEVSFLAAQQNAVGFPPLPPPVNGGNEGGAIAGRAFAAYGKNTNRILKDEGATILHMAIARRKDLTGFGDMALAAFADDAVGAASWESLDALRSDLAKNGAPRASESAGPSPAGQTLDGALAVPFALKPGESRSVTFLLAWHFPNATHGRGAWGGKGNMYANWWPSALDVARDVHKRYGELARLTRLYHDTFYAGNLPHWLLDRITSQVAILRSKTCFWTKDGYFGGWEGCNPGTGCCHGNCAHVWHYAQAHARLFPSIARRMREQALRHQAPDGGIPFRQPTGAVATDGQCGEILEALREHLCTTDATWLAAHWPKIKKAMDYAIRRWDNDEDGALAGPQHNTLDASLGGSTTWLGSMYLAALAASEKMALLQGDAKAARRFRTIREAGMKRQNETLWNGEYYIQIPDKDSHRDFLTGCDVDQMLGQWWAHQLDLGWLYPPDRVQTAMRSLFKHNFLTDFHGFRQSPRKFVDEEDAGLLDMTWPKGGRPEPRKCIMYANEVQSGYEAAAFVAMVQAGLLQEGFAAARAAADRYDGRLRTGLSGGNYTSWGYSGNPFGDDECGKFYARAMSIWSMLLACQGFAYDGPAARIGFRPLWKPDAHASFFTAAEAWGLFTQKRTKRTQAERLDVAYGTLTVRELVFELPKGAAPATLAVSLDGRGVPAWHQLVGQRLGLALAEPLVVKAGSSLKIAVALGR